MKTDIASSQSITLDIPGGEYFLTTFENGDAESLHEVLAIDSVSDRLSRFPSRKSSPPHSFVPYHLCLIFL
jgi:hypothetical protein